MNIWKLIRLVFVVFSLYLLGDAFYRWDAFRYYGSFQEFLPGFALMSILWSFLGVVTAIFMWLLLRIFGWFCRLLRLRIYKEHLLLYIGFFVLFTVSIWMIKRLSWPLEQSTFQLKITILTGVTIISFFFTWISRDKVSRWIDIVNERITPLVWLFGVILILSLPLVSYLSWSNLTEKAQSKDTVEYSGTQSRPNITLITFDTLTARDMSAYGYDRETTPFISEWAKSATLFTRHEAASNYTSPTTASLMTGKRVWTHRRFQSHARKPYKGDIENLPLLLKNAGYYNMAFVANHIASVHEMGIEDTFMVAPPAYEFISPSSLYGFLRKYLHRLFGSKIALFDWMLNGDFILHRITPNKYFKYPYKTQYPIQKGFNMFMAEVNSNQREPYFAWIHLYPPHLPYLAPDEYSELFDSSAKYRNAKSQDDLVKPRFFTQDQQIDADILRSRYDAFIRYCDKQFQDFIKLLENNGLLNNTVIILSSDHGESFEHGYFTHGGPLLYEQMTHLPLIIKEPDQKKGQIVNDLTEQVDVPATILDFAGIPLPSWMEGRSLVPRTRGEKLHERPVFSMNLQENLSRGQPITTGSIAVWEGNFKMIYYIKEKESLLFNLREDPDELNNLFATEIEVGQHLVSLIQNNLEKANERLKIEK